MLPKSITDRFWSKVDKSGDCWLWTGGRFGADGYPAFWDGTRTMRAHRFSYELTNGHLPDKLFVCHKCDVKLCVRPDHLFSGTTQDNMADMVAKGRQARGDRHGSTLHPDSVARGSKNGFARLTDEQAGNIKARYSRRRITYKMLAAEYGVSWHTIRAIINGRGWKHVA